MKRIAFYQPSFAGGGAERNSALMANYLVNLGYHVLMIVGRDEGSNRDLLDPGIPVVELAAKWNAARIRGVRAKLDEWNADVVFVSLGLCPLIAVLAGVFKRKDWKVVIAYHIPYVSTLPLGARVTWWVASILSRRSLATVSVSADVQNQLVKIFFAKENKVHVIHNPVDLTWIERASLETPVPGVAGFGKFILSVGRLVHEKGYPDLIRAYSLVKDKIEEDLVILGDGPLRADLEQLIKSENLEGRVHLVGYVSNPFPVYSRASVFVLASHFEGFGNVLVEALACGIPVIATNCVGGPKEILEHGNYGRLVEVGNPDALAAAILDTMSHAPDRERLKQRSKAFALPKVMEKYLNIIRSA